MRIQLFLADHEVDLTQNIQFPLNKSYENLSDPTKILVEYSKTISLPITKNNNKIFGNIYRLDRTILDGGLEGDMGIYFDPTKRIPARLMYNGKLVLDGYAKFNSSNYSIKTQVYNINLYGKLGSIFQELRNVVIDENKLGDLDRRYLIENSDCWVVYQTYKLDRDFVSTSFFSPDNKCWDPKRDSYNDNYWVHDVIGFAPSHRGLYSDFGSTKIQIDSTNIKEISEVLKSEWTNTLINSGASSSTAPTLAEKLGASDIVGSGFKDYEMKEFRSYKMKPYIYFNQLMKVFANKCKTITDYEFELDRDWFNVNNPYWSKICYMFDYLDSTKIPKGEGVKELLMEGNSTSDIQSSYYDKSVRQTGIIMDTISSTSLSSLSSDGCILNPFDVYFGCSIIDPTEGKRIISNVSILPDTQVFFEFEVFRKTGYNTQQSVGKFKFWTNGAKDANATAEYNGYDSSNYVQLQGGGAGGGILMSTRAIPTLDGYVRYNVTIPQIILTGDFSQGMELKLTTILINNVGYPQNTSSDMTGLYVWNEAVQYGNITVPTHTPVNTEMFKINGIPQEGRSVSFFVTYGDIYQSKDWRENTYISLSNIYKKDTPLFDIILEYTKMFGLHWDIDYDNKKIKIVTRNKIFKDYTIENWNDKIDRGRDFIAEPVTFQDRYIVFNYEDKEGHIYSGYRDKFGVNIGEKVLSTQYIFNNDENDLFKGIHPSSSSSKTFIPFMDWYNWNTKSIINPKTEQYILMDCEDEAEEKSISLNNWYLRGSNVSNEEFIVTDDSPLMITNDSSCYYLPSYAVSSGMGVKPDSLPTFSIAAKYKDYEFWNNKATYGGVFNTPNEDYTYNLSVSDIGGNNIYEMFWKDYLNERYNIQNKKLTAYVYLSDEEFTNFTFNKFVVINNQLFMINNIIDYDLNSNGSTKIEFVQVTDPNALVTTTFPQIASQSNKIVVKGSSDPSSPYYKESDEITISQYVYGVPYVDDVSIEGDIYNYVDEYGTDDMESNGLYFYSYFYDLSGQYLTGKINFKNSLDETYTIDIILDFREWV